MSPTQLHLHAIAAERRLWSALRDCRLRGLRFARQLRVDRHLTDFACVNERVVVEVDAVHDLKSAAQRVPYGALERLGYRVLRFSPEAVLQQPRFVLATIAAACGRGPYLVSRVSLVSLVERAPSP
ncbi:MAG TPA: DUF559 domain-containing protein [Myxococcota bacterium]|jgi:very-short-patch-repair endonuclease